MAFHLGCFRALHDRQILGKVKVISTVSGGSVIGSCWAYRGEDFAAFDRHMVSVLRRGLQWDIVREAFFSCEAPKILGTVLLTGTLSLILSLLSLIASRARRWLGIPTAGLEDWLVARARRLPVWGSLTTAFEAALSRHFFGERTVNQVQRPG
jgi:NTE family protein